MLQRAELNDLSRDSESSTSSNNVLEATSRNYAYALLALALLVVIASAAVLAALYAPEHMPTAISAIVNNLNPFIQNAIIGVAWATGGVGLLGMAYQGGKFFNKKTNASNDFIIQIASNKSVEQTYDHGSSPNQNAYVDEFELFEDDDSAESQKDEQNSQSFSILRDSSECFTL